MSTTPAHLVPQSGSHIPRQSPDAVPNCQKCGKPMRLVGESTETWQWGCEPCGCAHVFSKPRARAAARHLVSMKRAADFQSRIRAHNSRPKYFLLRSK